MVYNVAFGLTLVILISSCGKYNREDSQSQSKSDRSQVSDTATRLTVPSARYDSLDLWQHKVLIEGDQAAYNNLRRISLDMPQSCFLFYAFTMANKYDYAAAYTDVYMVLVDANSCDYSSPECLDAQSRKIALEYLRLGALKGDGNALEILNGIAGSSMDE